MVLLASIMEWMESAAREAEMPEIFSEELAEADPVKKQTIRSSAVAGRAINTLRIRFSLRKLSFNGMSKKRKAIQTG